MEMGVAYNENLVEIVADLLVGESGVEFLRMSRIHSGRESPYFEISIVDPLCDQTRGTRLRIAHNVNQLQRVESVLRVEHTGIMLGPPFKF